jgi:hypothetical protein
MTVYRSKTEERGRAKSSRNLRINFESIRRKRMSVMFTRSVDGTYLPLTGNEPPVAPSAEGGAAETFTLDELDVKPHGGCCGPAAPRAAGEADLLWDDKAHKRILERATELMAGTAVRDLPNVRLFLEAFWSSKDFSDAVFQGLHDADYVSPWTDPTVEMFNRKISMFGYHFCDADTLRTFPLITAIPGWAPFSAMTECQRYFDLSAYEARRALRLGPEVPASVLRAAGHSLGVALHFLTDLTQPMHAANFANIVGENEFPNIDDYRHSKFEEYADRKVAAGFLDQLPAIPRANLDEPALRHTHPGTVIQAVARASKEVWRAVLGPLARKKPRTSEPWGSEADPALEASLKLAPGRVAHFLTYWARAARQDLEATHGLRRGQWYRLVEPTKKEVLAPNGDGWIYRHARGGDQRVFILFNADGTACLGTNTDSKKTWQFVDAATGTYLRAADSSNHPEARFRVAPVERRLLLYTQRRIHGSGGSRNGDQVVTVSDLTGSVFRAQPELAAMRPVAEKETQLLALENAGPMTEAERQQLIVSRGASALEMPWWGLADEPARWRNWRQMDANPPSRTSGLATASRGSGLLDVFAIADGKLYTREWLGIWNPWTLIGSPAGVKLTGAVAATSWSRTRLDVFALGDDQRMHQAFFTSESGKWTWETFGEIVGSSKEIRFAACAPDEGRLDVFALIDGNLRRKAWNGSAWSGWADVPANSGAREALVSDIAAVSIAKNARHVISIGADRRARVITSRDGQRWTWFALPDEAFPAGVSMRSVAAVGWGDRLTIEMTGSNATLAQRAFTGTWRPWQHGPLPGGTTPTAYAAASWGPYRIDVIAADPGGAIRQRTFQ